MATAVIVVLVAVCILFRYSKYQNSVDVKNTQNNMDKVITIELTSADVGQTKQVEGGTIKLVSINDISKGYVNADQVGYNLEIEHIGNLAIKVKILDDKGGESLIIGKTPTKTLDTYSYVTKAAKVIVDIELNPLTEEQAIEIVRKYEKEKNNSNFDASKFEQVYVSVIDDNMWKVVGVLSKTKAYSWNINPKTRQVVDYNVGD